MLFVLGLDVAMRRISFENINLLMVVDFSQTEAKPSGKGLMLPLPT